MGQVVVVGLDIAKSVFQVHGVDRDGAVVVRSLPRKLALVDAEGSPLYVTLGYPLHDEHPSWLTWIPAQPPLFPAPEHPTHSQHLRCPRPYGWLVMIELVLG